MSLKIFKVTRVIRRRQHLFGVNKPETVRRDKALARRGERRRVRRELEVRLDLE